MADIIQSRPYKPEQCCERCAFGRGKHAEWCQTGPWKFPANRARDAAVDDATAASGEFECGYSPDREPSTKPTLLSDAEQWCALLGSNAIAGGGLMPRYKCHKQVWALKIAELQLESLPKWQGRTCRSSGRRGSYELRSACGRCERCTWELSHPFGVGAVIVPADAGYGSFHVDRAYLNTHKPEVGGYYVVYRDGYQSFSPAKAFEEGYTLVEAAV